MYLQSIPCAAGNPVQAGLGCPGLCCGGGCGLGIFDSGFDVSQWGLAEWVVGAAAVYVAFSVFSTTKRGVRAVRAIPRKRRQRKIAALEKRLELVRGSKRPTRKALL